MPVNVQLFMVFMDDLANFKIVSKVTDYIVDGLLELSGIDSGDPLLSKIKLIIFAFLLLSFLMLLTLILWIAHKKTKL